MPRKIFLFIMLIVVVPVSMTCWKIVQYAAVSKAQVYDLHHHIAHTLALNTTAYFQQLNMRLAFAPLLARSNIWSEQVSVLNNALLSNSDFACVALLDANGKERMKAFDAALGFFNIPLDYSQNPFFLQVQKKQSADTGSVYENNKQSFFDIIYPLSNGSYLLVSVRWESLKNLLFDQQVGNEGSIWLIDELGRIVGDSKELYVGQTFNNWKFFNNREDDKSEWQGEFTNPFGIDMAGASAWVKGAGWLIVSAQPQSEAYAKIYQLRRSAFLWMGFSLLGMIFFGYFWVNYISNPITRLSAGVQSVANRKFDAAVPEDFGLEEFRALGQAFNQMVTKLKSYDQIQVDKIVEQHTTNQSILMSIHDGIIMLNDKSEIIFANDPAQTWAMEVAGRGKGFEYAWQSLQEYPPFMDVLGPVLDNEKTTGTDQFEFLVQGRKKWARVIAQQVLTESGRRLGVMIVVRDVTQEKEVDQMKEDFFNGITHDLRTPLAATIGYLGLGEMQSMGGDPELNKLIGSAKQSAKRALGLVETILSLARLQAGKLAITRVPMQAQAIIAKTVADMTFIAQMKKMTLTWECEDSDLWISGDQGLMERVVENLTGNAIKYTMEGGWVKLTARMVETGVEIAVTDNGRGIPKEAIDKLFGKFQQVKSEDRAVGFGIGLSFCKGIIEAHESTITIESEVGKGSKFFFILPRVAAAAAAETPKAA